MFRTTTRIIFQTSVLTLTLLFLPAFSPAAVFNIHLYSDSSPNYTTRQSFLETALPIWETPEEKAIALWRWGVRHRRQVTTTREDNRNIFDPILFFNNYGGTNCGYITGMLEGFNEGLGDPWRGRYVQLSDHTVMEMSWDSGLNWHLFDASMVVYCRDTEGNIASVEQITESHVSELSLAMGETGPVPGHHYLYNFALECGSNPVNPAHDGDLAYPWGYRTGTDNPVSYSRTLRNGADSYLTSFYYEDSYTHVRHGWVYRLNLKQYESYTRYWSHLGETEDFYRPDHHGDDPDAGSIAGDIRGNGIWQFAPDLGTTNYRLVMHDESQTAHRLEATTSGPNIHPQASDQLASVSFKVYGANVITSGKIHLTAQRQNSQDILRVLVSRDSGINWNTVWTADTYGAIDTDIPLSTDLLGGAFEYLCKVEMTAADNPSDCGIYGLEIETITMVNRLSLPRLQKGANHIAFKLGDQEESFMLWPALHDEGSGPLFQKTVDSFSNVYAATSSDQFYRAVLRPVTGNTPAHVTWRFNTPTDITGLNFGGSFLARDTGTWDRIDLSHGFDGVIFSDDTTFDHTSSRTYDGRMYATAADILPGKKSVWLKYKFSSSHDETYTSTGIQDALMYVNYTPRDYEQQPVEVTWCWTEHRKDGNVERQYTRLVASDTDNWQINVGGYRDPTMNWIRVNLQGYGPDGAVSYGYSDGLNVGSSAGYDRKKFQFRWEDNVAFGRSYVVGRGADSSNPDTGGQELTNGCIVPPTDYATDWSVQEQSSLWSGDQPVVVTIDLEQSQPLAAVRITTHQPNESYCHADSIGIEYSADGVVFQAYQGIGHDQIWSPPGDYIGWEHDRSSSFADLPALGRLAFPFWAIASGSTVGRYVRCTFYPQNGRGVGISEIQVLSQISVMDWPDREVFMEGTSAVGQDFEEGDFWEDGLLGHHGKTLIQCNPNPFNATTRIQYAVTVGAVASLTVYDLAGRVVRVLVDEKWHDVQVYSVHWDGKDASGRTVASGAYIFRVEAAGVQDQMKVLMVK